MQKNITIIGNHKLINEDETYKHLYKSLKWFTKQKKGINIEFLKKHTEKRELIYHPIWFAKLLIIAERKPFPPKKSSGMVFIDAVSGYRGLLSSNPITVDDEIKPFAKQIKPIIIQLDHLKRYIRDVQQKQINRSYIFKKPKYKILDYNLVYLPLWKLKISSTTFNQVDFINANTGESENYMASLWNSTKWLKYNS